MIDEQGRYLPSHLSPSQLTLYRLCPTLYRERYVLNLYPPPQPERLFGVAMHAGLEALYRGQDDEQAFLKSWRELASSLDKDLYPLLPALRGRGLELLEMVRGLELSGEPERLVTITAPDFLIPIIGYVDLWSPEAHTIYDFKTAGFGWNQTRVDNQLFQPAIYSQAWADEYGGIPEFKFVILPRVPGPVTVLDATKSGAQIEEAFTEALRIHRAIEDQQWGCTCRGKYHLFSDGWADFEEEVSLKQKRAA